MKFNKKGQVMGLPFQMIFTLILIAIFIVVGVFAIKYVVDWQKQSQAALFVNDFRNKVNELWQKDIVDYTFSESLASQVKYVCFANVSLPNTTTEFSNVWHDLTKYQGYTMFLWPTNAVNIPNYKIEHIDFSKLPRPYCIANTGKISIRLQKNSSEALLRIVP